MRSRRGVRLTVEALEARELLAVTAVVTDEGNLVIRGDNAGSDISVNQTDLPPDMFRIVPFFTMVNGSEDDVILGGVTGDVRVIMGTGNDSFGMTGMVPRHFRYTDRGGDNAIVLFGLGVGGNLMVNGARGEDVVVLFETAVAGKTTIGTRGGNDTVELIDAVLAGRVRVEAGAGNDTFVVAGSMFGGSFEARGGAGMDGLDAGIMDGDDNGNTYDDMPQFRGFEALLS